MSVAFQRVDRTMRIWSVGRYVRRRSGSDRAIATGPLAYQERTCRYRGALAVREKSSKAMVPFSFGNRIWSRTDTVLSGITAEPMIGIQPSVVSAREARG